MAVLRQAPRTPVSLKRSATFGARSRHNALLLVWFYCSLTRLAGVIFESGKATVIPMINDLEFQIANTEADIRAYVELLGITKGRQPREFPNTLLIQAEQKLRLLKEQQTHLQDPPPLSPHL
jgi:hypothetical protein